MQRELFTYPRTPASEGWGSFEDTEPEATHVVEIADLSSVEMLSLLADRGTALASFIKSREWDIAAAVR